MKFWKKALLINIAVILGIVLIAAAYFVSPWGNPLYKTALLVTETIPNFPIKPLKFMTRAPRVEEIELETNGKKIKADLYRPKDSGKHPAMILTLGILYMRDEPIVVNFAQALSRVGFVVLIPQLPDFTQGLIWTDSVKSLVTSYEYLDKNPYVLKEKIGYAGFCAGGSVSMVAAQELKISEKVSYIAAISPYYDSSTMVKSTLFKKQKINGRDVEWRPAKLTDDSLEIFFVNALQNPEKDFVYQHLINNEQLLLEDYGKLSDDAKGVYDFINLASEGNYDSLREKLPADLKVNLAAVSPSTRIDALRAKLFVLNDKKDTFVPRSEGLQLRARLTKDRLFFMEVDSFEHVNPATKLERWAAIRQTWNLFNYLYQIMAHNF